MRPITDAELMRLVGFVRQKYGINLEKKRTLIEARLSSDTSLKGYRTYTEYLNAVIPEPENAECRHMIDRLSTNHTFFFREPGYIGFLNRHLLPGLSRQGRPFRIWCAACASGEEPYSLAMVLERFVAASGQKLDYEIIATDINTQTLATAEAGVYPIKSFDNIPIEYRQYVTCKGDHMEIGDAIRERIIWRRENLLECAYSQCMDVIFCRNVMIYFRAEDREFLARRLYDALVQGGYLFISSVESIDMERKLFEHREPSIYRKREALE